MKVVLEDMDSRNPMYRHHKSICKYYLERISRQRLLERPKPQTRTLRSSIYKPLCKMSQDKL